jgi:D-3-phosphoglycerate dehydrogenase
LRKILFIDTVHPVLIEELRGMGLICEEDLDSDYSAIKAKIGAYYGVVIRSRIPFNRELLKAAENLKFIARSGAGLENIDMHAAHEMGVAVFNSPEGNRDAVGEHAIGMLLSLLNHLSRSDNQVRRGIWDREGNRGIELSGKTVGIIGFGQMGSGLAEKLQGFGCRIISYDKYKKEYAPDYVDEVSLLELQSESDIISVHLPYSQETLYYINREFIEACKKPFYLINTARGKHVHTRDLLQALEERKVLGACLDVLEFEKSSFEHLAFEEMPEAFKQLVSREDVLLSPHVAGWTNESYVKLSTFLFNKVKKFLDDEDGKLPSPNK